jgi:hypothetical protein
MYIPEEIIELAKYNMELYGGFEPSLFVIGTKEKVRMSVPIGRGSAERVQFMTDAGVELAQSGLASQVIGDLKLVVFVSEAWVSPAREKMVMPSQDPDRTEALIITALDPNTMEQMLQMFTFVRDRKQAVIELKPISMPKEGTVESPLLRAFLSGFRLFSR